MATQYANGKIVTNGLVLSLDAADRNSYVSGSTVWNDMSGYNSHMTLVNSPIFVEERGGGSYISFDGSNDYGSTTVLVPDTTTGDRCCFECFCYGPMTNNTMLMSWGVALHDIYLVSNGIGFNSYNGDVYGVATQPLVNKWNHISLNFYRGDYTLASMYINGILQSLNVFTTSQNVNNVRFGGGAMRIAAGGDNAYYGNWRFNMVRVYNRSLSAQEILQNYNAQKSRFGL